MRTILELQAEANGVMSDDWRTSTNDTIPYYRAGHVETSELLMHMGFKWWKNEHPDEESYRVAHGQAVMELADIMHFAASDLYRQFIAAGIEISNIADSEFEVLYPHLYSIGRFSERRGDVEPSNILYSDLTLQDLCEQAVYAQLRDGTCYWVYVNVLAEALGVTANHLFATYIGKNTLNKFRTSNGQRQGTYAKIWDGQEDNIYLTNYIHQLQETGSDVNQAELLDFLTERYQHFTDLGKTERA